MTTRPIRVIAEVVEDLDDAVVYSLGLSESPDAEAFLVILSASEPDREGAGVCVVVEPGQLTAYDAVASGELIDGNLTLRLTETGTKRLGVPSVLTLELETGIDGIATLERGFSRLGIPLASNRT